ncbi:MAG: hypothetical protein H6721_14475 [Sandaracinus sp.]|nr:hypothetical protein [Sandaracinus sp.]
MAGATGNARYVDTFDRGGVPGRRRPRYVDTFDRGGVPGFAWVDDRTLEALALQCGG